MSQPAPPDWIAAASLPDFGPLALRRALSHHRDPARIAHDLPVRQLATFTRKKLDPAKIEETRRDLRRRAHRLWRQCQAVGIRQLTEADPDYPAALREIPAPPLLLYLRGALHPTQLHIAVIGSRNPTHYGRRVATGLGQDLAARDIVTVSGGARGIDTCAHKGALTAAGKTVAVLGSGLLCPYPSENKRLFDEIAASGGALLSELPPDAPPKPAHFPARNRLISGLGSATVVVEAARRSGSLGTAARALEQNREVMAIPGPVTSTRSEGTNSLIQQGAKLVQNIEDILEELPPLFRGAARPEAPEPPGETPPPWTDDEAAVLVMMDPIEPVHVDELVERAPFGIARLQAALFGLETWGAVDPLPGRYYLLRPRKEP